MGERVPRPMATLRTPAGKQGWTDHLPVTVSAMRPVRHCLAMPNSPSAAMLQAPFGQSMVYDQTTPTYCYAVPNFAL